MGMKVQMKFNKMLAFRFLFSTAAISERLKSTSMLWGPQLSCVQAAEIKEKQSKVLVAGESAALLTQLCAQQHRADQLAATVIWPRCGWMLVPVALTPVEQRAPWDAHAELQLGEDNGAAQPGLLQLMGMGWDDNRPISDILVNHCIWITHAEQSTCRTLRCAWWLR